MDRSDNITSILQVLSFLICLYHFQASSSGVRIERSIISRTEESESRTNDRAIRLDVISRHSEMDVENEASTHNKTNRKILAIDYDQGISESEINILQDLSIGRGVAGTTICKSGAGWLDDS